MSKRASSERQHRSNRSRALLLSALLVVAACRTDTVVAPPTSTTTAPPTTTSSTCKSLAPPVAPNSVSNAGIIYTRSVDVTWQPVITGCTLVDHYDVVSLNDAGTPVHTVLSAPVTDRPQATVTGLDLCTFYRFGVIAIGTNGQPSPLALPARAAFTYARADKTPMVVSIVLQGIASEGAADSFNPQETAFCTSSNGTEPPYSTSQALQVMATRWLNYDSPGDPAAPQAGSGNNLIDSLASTGGYVLPFSYNGASVTATADGPSFQTTAYSKEDVAASTIQGEVMILDNEIANVRMVWPTARIIVVGHSNGGLIAEQWWLNHRSDLHQVTQVFALDSPLNGVARASQCLGAILEKHCLGFGVGTALAAFYANLWQHQSTNDPYWVAQDDQDKIFTPVGTIGDPLYDAGDWVATSTFGVKNIGIVSQLYFSQPRCAQAFDLSSHDCTIIGRSFLDPCGPLDDSTGPFFGAPRDLPLHSVVKNCPGVIKQIMGYFGSPVSPPQPRPKPPAATDCSSVIFLKVVRTLGSQFTGTTGPPTCLDGYAQQDFTFPLGPTSNYPTYFFHLAPGGTRGWDMIGGGAIGDVTYTCSQLPPQVRAAFLRPPSQNSGCPAG